jgi:AICAR transformylase/IMP cyclohydrolase PurH
MKVLSGAPSYINVLDAIRGWKLVRELRRRFAAPAAASYKHGNPAGVGVGRSSLDENYRRMHFLRGLALSPLAIAYLRARHADRVASYGDFAALSDTVDVEMAQVLKSTASDGVIAPGYRSEALSILKGKRNGRFITLAIDPCYEPLIAPDRRCALKHHLSRTIKFHWNSNYGDVSGNGLIFPGLSL